MTTRRNRAPASARTLARTLTLAGLSALVLAAGCGRGTLATRPSPASAPSRPQSGWDLFNQPELVAGARGYTTRLEDLPEKADLPSKPWRGAFWAHQTGGIAFRWLSSNPENFTYAPPTQAQVARMSREELSRLSPAEKFDIFRGRFDYPTVAREWTRTSPRALPWEGLCDGLAIAQLLYEEPKPVLLRGTGGIEVPFGSADVKALLALDKGFSRRPDQGIVGIQCVSRDPAADALCKSDMNAGTFHVVLANQIALRKEGFLADVDWTEEVWNHVVYGYEAKTLGERAPSPGAAAGTVKERLLRTTVFQSLIRPPDWNPQPANDDLDGYVTYEYALEIDARDRIIGGSWISEEHPDFLWTVDPKEKDLEKLDSDTASIFRASLSPLVPAPAPGPQAEPTPAVTPTALPTAVPTPVSTPTPKPTPVVVPTLAPTPRPSPVPTPRRGGVAATDLQHLRTLLSQISLGVQAIGATLQNVSAKDHVCDVRFRYSTVAGDQVVWADSETLGGVEIYAGTQANPMTRVSLPPGHKMRSVQTLARCEDETGFTGVPINLRP